MDPQQRLLLEVAAEAMLAKGSLPADISGAGVFVGITSTEYGQLVEVRWPSLCCRVPPFLNLAVD